MSFLPDSIASAPTAWVFEAVQQPVIFTPLFLLSYPLPRGNAKRFLSNTTLLLEIFSWGLQKGRDSQKQLGVAAWPLRSSSGPLTSRSTVRKMTQSYPCLFGWT